MNHMWVSNGPDGFYCDCGAYATKTPQNYGKPYLPLGPCSGQVIIEKEKSTMDHLWTIFHKGLQCVICGVDASSSINTKCYAPGSLLDRKGGMVPTVKLNSKASRGVSPAEEAIEKIKELLNEANSNTVFKMTVRAIIEELE